MVEPTQYHGSLTEQMVLQEQVVQMVHQVHQELRVQTEHRVQVELQGLGLIGWEVGLI